jgi:hypothetical protein
MKEDKVMDDIDSIIQDAINALLANRREYGLPLPCPSFEEYELRRTRNHNGFDVDRDVVGINLHGVVL